MTRREFLARGATVAAAAAAPRLARGAQPGDAPAPITVVADPRDPVVGAAPSRWAAERLRTALRRRGFEVRSAASLTDAGPGEFCLALGGGRSELARAAGLAVPAEAESFGLTAAVLGGRTALVAAGADPRGLAYAANEVADALECGEPTRAVLQPSTPVIERPANAIRSVMRLVVSEVEDAGWYHDRGFWRSYLSLLAAQRFNRFNLALGLGYDRPNDLTDTYFYFAYPFLVRVPGYDVRATGVSRADQDRNLETLRFISDEAAARGLHFQLGIWTHAFVWNRSPHATHVIEGLTAATQAAYCRDALAAVLRECPAIAGVTFRIHGESGVPEGSYEIWRTIFDGCVRSGRPVELDLHAKGMDQPTLDLALATGLPVTISPKFSAEHQGLPYHQAAIREAERPKRARGEGLYAQSSGARSFLRYGYGDLLRADRRYRLLHRFWPGTQHLLLWGDPLFAAAYGRAVGFCGSAGGEIFDPLSYKGRDGSSRAGNGGRGGYADPALRPEGGDFEKYAYTYRVWGRYLYRPDTPAAAVTRGLRPPLGVAAPAAAAALASASRILPLVTSANLPTASNYTYWPEMALNFSLVGAKRERPYGETTAPCRFGNASPLDPQLFVSPDEFAQSALTGTTTARYSPIEVAQWLEDLAAAAERQLGKAAGAAGAPFRRLSIDVRAQALLGRFYGRKLRAAVLLALYEGTGDPEALSAAVRTYQEARDAWARLAEATTPVYVADLTFGAPDFQRGHWRDRLPGIDADITLLQSQHRVPVRSASALIAAALGSPTRPVAACTHTPPAAPLVRGQALSLSLTLDAGAPATDVILHYRHAQQAERWQRLPMYRSGSGYAAMIPAAYTASPFLLLYYFELRRAAAPPTLHPGLGPDLTTTPYYTLV